MYIVKDENKLIISFVLNLLNKTFNFIIELKYRYEVKELKQENNNQEQKINELYEFFPYKDFEFSGPYIYNNTTVGSNNVKDLLNKTQMNGIAANTPGWIIIELTRNANFDEIEIGGIRFNNTIWGYNNGAGAKILTSSDKVNWACVGYIPDNFETITRVRLGMSYDVKYIKFEHTSYLGIGYLKINNI